MCHKSSWCEATSGGHVVGKARPFAGFTTTRGSFTVMDTTNERARSCWGCQRSVAWAGALTRPKKRE